MRIEKMKRAAALLLVLSAVFIMTACQTNSQPEAAPTPETETTGLSQLKPDTQAQTTADTVQITASPTQTPLATNEVTDAPYKGAGENTGTEQEEGYDASKNGTWEEKSTPNVLGMTEAEAVSTLKAFGFTTIRVFYENYPCPAGTVSRQDYPTKMYDWELTVNWDIYVSNGPYIITVPNYERRILNVNFDMNDIDYRITWCDGMRGENVTFSYIYSVNHRKDEIVKTSPAAGTTFTQGGNFTVYVSKGYSVENFTGWTWTKYHNYTVNSPYVAGVSREYSDTVPKDSIISQSISPGTVLTGNESTWIAVTLSNGPDPNKPTATPEATATPETTPTPEVTATPTPEATATPTPEATATPTPEVTATPTPEVTATPTPAPTPEATATAETTP